MSFDQIDGMAEIPLFPGIRRSGVILAVAPRDENVP